MFCEFLAEINKKINEPYYFDILFTFFMMFARAINEEQSDCPEDSSIPEEDEEEEEEQEEEEGEEEEEEGAKKIKRSRVCHKLIRNIVGLVNPFLMKKIPKYRQEYQLEQAPLFYNSNVAKLIELFFNWLTNKKYLGHRVKINDKYPLESIGKEEEGD